MSVYFRYFAFELGASDLADWANGNYIGPNPPSDFFGIFGLARGLEYIHANKHVHRDLCPRNVLISAKGDRLIISDFGLVKMVHDKGSFSVSKPNGQEHWLAPERIQQKYDPSYRVTIDSDTWSMGCLFYYFLTKGAHPFGDIDVDLRQRVLKGRHKLDRNQKYDSRILSSQFLK